MGPDPSVALRAEGLTKRFPSGWWGKGGPAVLDGVDLELPSNAITFLIGLNGAGKTTLLRCLAGYLIPDAGRIVMDGAERPAAAWPDPATLCMVAADERSFYQRLSVRENLRFFASLRGFSGGARDAAVADVLAAAELEELATRRFALLSAGQKQRVGLARGLLGNPRILLLDEVTRSLDPLAAQRVRARLVAWVQQVPGRAILFTTHSPHDLLADAAVYALEAGRSRRLRHVASVSRIAVTGTGRWPESALPPGCALAAHDDAWTVTVPAGPAQALEQVLGAARAAGLPVTGCSGEAPDLAQWLQSTGDAP